MLPEGATVGQPAPDFDLPRTRVRDSPERRATLASYRGRWLVLMFYPRDFSLVCPTELTAMNARIEEFRRRGCDVLAVSTDLLGTHESWIATPRSQGGLGELAFPLGSDVDGAASKAYGVYQECEHVALRGLFIIDPNAILQYKGVHNLAVGRRSDEVLRILAALQIGGMCPESWCPDVPVLDPTRLLRSGSMMSHYRIEEEVGRGGSAAVFRAWDTLLRRDVALKVFSPGCLPSAANVLAEARTAAALNHPNICTVFAVDESEGVPIIAMEFVPGRPLSRVLQDGALGPRKSTGISRQIALGMAAAHGAGIVHGDLKPANILITEAGGAKVTDFGLARRLEASPREDEDETRVLGLAGSGTIAGTPGYMSPEQARGEAATAASDVFAVGAILYEMLTGQKAFPGSNLLQILSRTRAVQPGRYAAEVPEPFAAVLAKCLLADPRERLITMREIAEAIG